MTRNVVNLDALIPREDLAAPVDANADIPGLKISDLKPGLIYSWLRKPDFQRETANWSPEQVADLIETFANGNIIPAIILWQNGQRVFVIDGAHRLSALIGWAQDDYGGGSLSASHYQNSIPEQQRLMHEATKKLVAERVGSYSTHELAAQFQKADSPEILKRASTIGFKGIDVQWIKNANVEQARSAFFRINQGGTEIDATETRILRAKDSALAIASRAISRGGTGHSYWKKFQEPERSQIEASAAELHRMLFMPTLNVPIKTLDIPLAGFGYGASVLPLAFDLVRLSNELSIPDSTNRKRKVVDNLQGDPDGKETIQYLRAAKKSAELLLSNDPASLGLHPALYFYTSSGAFQREALFNVLAWATQIVDGNRVVFFLKKRAEFEKLLMDHPVLSKPAVHKLGSGGRSRKRMVQLYDRILDLLSDGKSTDETWATIISEVEFKFLATDDLEQKQQENEGKPHSKFTRASKSAGFLDQALSSAPKCDLCGGLLHVNGIVTDHKADKAVGGSSASVNAQPVHPRCNSEKAALA